MEGIAHGDARHLSEKIGEQPEEHCEAEKYVEFSIPSWMVGRELGKSIFLILLMFAGSEWS